MEPNNGVQQQSQPVPQQQQMTPAPQQQQTPQQQQQFQQPTTPQVQYQPIDPRTGQIVQPQQTQQQASQQSQISEEALANRLRNDLATTFNLPASELPTDYQSLLRINAGAFKIMQQQQQQQTQQSLPKPPEVVQQRTQSDPLAEKQLPPGWQNLVRQDASGQWQPTSPHFMQIAQDANYNEMVRESRKNALSSGQFLLEHQQTIEQIVNQRLAVEREQLRGEMFLNQHRNELYETNPDGSVKMQIDPMTMQQVEARTPLGLEMRAAAEELKKYGARFDSAVDLANMALTIARERIKVKQAQQPQNIQQPQQPQYNKDLQELLNGHQRSGTTQAGTVNTAPQQFRDFRSEMRSVLQNVPDNASGMELAKALGLNFGS